MTHTAPPAAPDLTGRRAIVTGGASGIGRSTARLLAEHGASVVIGDVDEAAGRAAAAEVGATFAVLDVADPVAWDRVVAATGPFDVAFLNAGVATNSGDEAAPQGFDFDVVPVVGLADSAYRRIMSINVDGVVFGTRAVLPAMLDAGRGDIVVTASMAGLGPIAFDPVYGLTKHAVVGFVRSMASALDGRPDVDIHVSAVCPGFTETGIITDELRRRVADRGLEMMPPERVGEVVMRALRERVSGAQWVVWPGLEPAPYEWNPSHPVVEADPPDDVPDDPPGDVATSG